MRCRLPCFALLAGCSFNPANPIIDGPVDTATDVPPDASNPRFNTGLVGFWTFDDGTGATVADSTQAIDPAFGKAPMPLDIAPLASTEWVDGGLRINDRVSITSPAQPQAHLCRDIKSANAVTLEIWATPSDTLQGASDYAVLFTLSPNETYRNATIAQRGDLFVARLLTTANTASRGVDPEILSAAGTATPSPTHLVLVADTNQRTLYVNGQEIPSTAAGQLSNWVDNYRISIGDEMGGSDHHWEGTLWLVAAYERALTKDQVIQNFLAGFDCTSC